MGTVTFSVQALATPEHVNELLNAYVREPSPDSPPNLSILGLSDVLVTEIPDEVSEHTHFRDGPNVAAVPALPVVQRYFTMSYMLDQGVEPLLTTHSRNSHSVLHLPSGTLSVKAPLGIGREHQISGHTEFSRRFGRNTSVLRGVPMTLERRASMYNGHFFGHIAVLSVPA